MYGNPQYYDPNIQQAYNERMMQLQQQYPQFFQQPQYPTQGQQFVQAPQQTQPRQQAPTPKSLLVTSIDEARAQNVLDGSKYVFVDTSNGKIYTRQFDIQTGTAVLEIYEKVAPTPTEMSQEQPQQIDPMQELKSQVIGLQDKIVTLEKEIKNVQSTRNSTNAGTAESAGGTDDASSAADATAGGSPKRNSKQSDTVKS